MYENDIFEEAFLEGYYDAIDEMDYLNEISEPTPGYRDTLRKDIAARNKTYNDYMDMLGDKDMAKKVARSDYKSDRRINHTLARSKMETDAFRRKIEAMRSRRS